MAAFSVTTSAKIMQKLLNTLTKKTIPLKDLCQVFKHKPSHDPPHAIPSQNRAKSLVAYYYNIIAFPSLFILAILSIFDVITISDTAFKLLIIAVLPLIAKYKRTKQGGRKKKRLHNLQSKGCSPGGGREKTGEGS